MRGLAAAAAAVISSPRSPAVAVTRTNWLRKMTGRTEKRRDRDRDDAAVGATAVPTAAAPASPESPSTERRKTVSGPIGKFTASSSPPATIRALALPRSPHDDSSDSDSDSSPAAMAVAQLPPLLSLTGGAPLPPPLVSLPSPLGGHCSPNSGGHSRTMLESQEGVESGGESSDDPSALDREHYLWDQRSSTVVSPKSPNACVPSTMPLGSACRSL